MGDAASWIAAVTDLFGGGWTFAWVGPREHEDWRRDAASVMALKAIDPRGWNSVDHAPEVADGCGGTGGPFMAGKPEQLNSSLYEVCSASATQLLIALKGEWYQAANIPNFIDRRDALFRSSREILSRFGPSAAFFTNASDAQDDPNADLLNPDASGNASPSTPLTADLSSCPITEVGVFWAFWEDWE